MTDEKISHAIRPPSATERAEANRHWKRLAKLLQGQDFNRCLKVLAHALLYRAQFHGVPSAELVAFLRSIVSNYLANGQSTLHMSDEARAKLEGPESTVLPQWPTRAERRSIDRLLGRVYRSTDSLAVGLQLRVFFHGLMLMAEPAGMTHEALLIRLEVLDRMSRAHGPASRYLPRQMPEGFTNGQ